MLPHWRSEMIIDANHNDKLVNIALLNLNKIGPDLGIDL